MTDLLLKDEVYAIVGAGIEVHNTLGPGFLEAVYQEALAIEFGNRGIAYEEQFPIRIRYKDRLLEKYYAADFVVMGKIIVELKAITKLTNVDEAQLINYLRATGREVGVLMNFGSPGKLDWKRMVLQNRG